MKGNIFLQKIRNENIHNNMSINDRYHRKNFILINNSNSNTISTFSTLRKIEDLKRKYNYMNFNQKMNLRNTFKKILNLKKKYNSIDNNFNKKIIDTEPNYENNLKSKDIYRIQNTGQLSLINPNLYKNSNSNIYPHTDSGINDMLSISEKNALKKSNEINYQVKPKKYNANRNKISKLNIKMLKNNSERNNKTIREELLKFGKSIENFLNENNSTYNTKQVEDDNYFIDKTKPRTKSLCPIKERINKLTSVKKKINKINKDFFKENEKNNISNISFDSQAALDFKHIKPKIMKENSIEEYFKEELKDKNIKEHLSKPVLIRSLPRPKLNIPKYPSFFYNLAKKKL